ncbi:MAG: class I tRNA ligase family protein, partial [Candidatus Lindowbacteria bacterium]|nr:class I tRNA ligase family protein [Candidatus Lindowbacteria bacterium]
ILMVCTFGDATDVQWWREQNLPLRPIIGHNGRLTEVTWFDGAFDSLRPEVAEKYYSEISGKNIKAARKQIVELLRNPAGSISGDSPSLVGEPKAIEHPVKFFEKGERPLEFVTTRQWFVNVMDKKEQMLKKGDEVSWHPSFMKSRFVDWTQNLNLDWCISRQRYFGVPFPLWYKLDSNGEADFESPIVAEIKDLPVDPSENPPPGYTNDQRDQPDGFTAEADVFDTWFTSSLTPQISSHWKLDEKRHNALFPADIRPQSHEIIRTWAFYTMAKALLHEDSIPWKHVVISGWVLDPDRKKMSKSKGNTIVPMDLLEKYTSDGVRYWASSARLGVDTAVDETIFKVGKRLVTKLYNASKFVLSHETEGALEVSNEIDRAFIEKLRELVIKNTSSFEQFDYARVLADTETFFWRDFADAYIELAKKRAWDGDNSAVATLRLSLNVVLRLFAPFVPYITEDIWSCVFAEETGHKSVHISPWPTADGMRSISPPNSSESFATAVDCCYAINKKKTELGASAVRSTESLTVITHPSTRNVLELVIEDVMGATRTSNWTLSDSEDVSTGEFDVTDLVFSD